MKTVSETCHNTFKLYSRLVGVMMSESETDPVKHY